ncbi:response regulator [Paraburkholderia pallida]|uniref:Response regulator n=1 Tax=Paraburkholderia pallida TaxID=2547399 RepID=A0A4P7D875_9BURK|nr:response regulator [Paraburkholderia pallida]QBR03617.1 response regulator [Paraburkholderia pallida]
MQTILIVDDDPAIVVAWSRILRLKKFGVAIARDAEAGLTAANDLHPALIVTDRHMPGMDGVEFCCRLKCNPKLAEIPIILASAGEKPTLSEPMWDALWQKPVPVDVMLVTIERLLARPC